MTHTASTATTPRNFGLDVIRVVAILAVMVCHASLFFDDHNPLTFGVLPVLGVLGVELFFGLSGFLIGSILLDRRQTLTVFYIKRLMKIVPPYAIIAGIVFLATGAQDIGALLTHLSFVQNFSSGLADFFPVSWSLSIEFWFYLFAPLLFLGWLNVRRRSSQLLMTCIVVAAVFLVARIVYVYTIQPEWEMGVHRFIPLRLDALVFGVMAAVIVQRHQRLHDRITSPFLVVSNSIICAALCMAFGTLYYFDELNADRLLQSVGLSMMGLTVMGIVLAARRYIVYPARWPWAGKGIMFISLISYSLYLVHLFVYQFAVGMKGEAFMLYAFAFGASIVVAWVNYSTVEKRALYIRDILIRRRNVASSSIEAEIVKQL